MNQFIRNIVWMIIDIIICFFAFMLSILIIYEFKTPRGTFTDVMLVYALYIAFQIAFNLLLECYKSLWEHASVSEIFRQFGSAVCATAVILGFKYTGLIEFSGSVIVVAALICYGLTIAARFSNRWVLMAKNFVLTHREGSEVSRVMIVGGGAAGSLLIRRLDSLTDGKRKIPVVVIDDNPQLWNQLISGIRIVGGRDKMRETIDEYKIDEVIIGIPTINEAMTKLIFNECREAGVPLYMFPGVVSMQKLTAQKPVLREIDFDGLLGRDVIKIQKDWIDSYTKGKVILVTGGAGSIGSELCRQVLTYECSFLVIYDFSENGLFYLDQELSRLFSRDRFKIIIGSVRDKNRLRDVFEKYRPDVVFHAAAHKHVPMMEDNPAEAIKNNVFGTQNVINQSIESGAAKMILISTDKAVNPANVMGATKRVAEMLMQINNGRRGARAGAGESSGTEMAVVRFGNVLGSNGSVVPTMKKQIEEGGPVTVMHRDIERYFMTIPEAVELVLQAGALAKGGEIFVFDMGEPVRIYELACSLIRQAGLEPEVDIPIAITGLRPGEKMFEELFIEDEDMDSTQHKKIRIAKPMQHDADKLMEQLEKLRKLVETAPSDEVVKELFTIVPSQYHK